MENQEKELLFKVVKRMEYVVNEVSKSSKDYQDQDGHILFNMASFECAHCGSKAGWGSLSKEYTVCTNDDGTFDDLSVDIGIGFLCNKCDDLTHMSKHSIYGTELEKDFDGSCTPVFRKESDSKIHCGNDKYETTYETTLELMESFEEVNKIDN